VFDRILKPTKNAHDPRRANRKDHDNQRYLNAQSVRHSEVYNGILSCFFQGFSNALFRSFLNPNATRRRVECG
jgi:hypothetical protein